MEVDASALASSHDHAVQFYERDAFLVEVVARFVRDGLAAGEPVVVIATAEHRAGVLGELRTAEVDVASALAARWLVVLDAETTLAGLMDGDRIDLARFQASVGATLAEVRASRPQVGAAPVRVRAYGEMVDVLWRRGRADAALELEALWNQVCAEDDIDLLCGYAMGSFVRDPDSSGFARVCALHSAVRPAEDFLRLDHRDDQLREVARLQQQARVLRREIVRREEVEAALVHAIRLRDDFLAVAGHELRTPLTAANLHLEAALAAPGQPAGVRGHLDKSLRQQRRLGRLIDDLLDASRLTAGSIALEVTDLELGALVQAVVGRVAPAAARAGCALRVHADPPVVGRWDVARVEQVLEILLANAVKFGPGAPIDVTVARDATGALVAIRDRGVGIAAVDHARIFERFERAISTHHFGGLGLGLWIARRLAEVHGGSIGVESRPGDGAVFLLRLPATKTDPARHQ